MLNIFFTVIAFSAAIITNSGNTLTSNTLVAEEHNQCAGFIEFWYGLRPHIEKRDYKSISEHTHFPFTVEGVADWMEPKKVNVADFEVVLNDIFNDGQFSYLDKKSGEYIDTNTYHVLLDSEPEKGNYPPCHDNFARISDLEFQKIEGRWYLYSGYLSTIE